MSLGGNISRDYDCLFKLVLIGDSGVGKTNILSRFSSNSFSLQSKPTIGVQFATKTIKARDKMVKMQVWDTAGQERFRAITHAYYKGAVGGMLVFDITRKATFQNVDKWMKEVRDNAEEGVTIMLVGNKCDMTEQRAVKTQQAMDYASKNRLIYVETSALLDNDNIEVAFRQLVQEILSTIPTTSTKNRVEPQLLKQVPVATPQQKVHLKSSPQKDKTQKNCC